MLFRSSTVSPLVGAQLGGSAAWAGAPSATYQAGAALVAFLWGVLMDRIGRRPTLALGVSLGALGAAIASFSVTLHALLPFLAGIALMGMANSALQLGRFVAAEVSPPDARGRAISTVVLGGTVGAVLGPFLAAPAGATARSFGLDELSGPYATSALLFLAVAALLLLRLHPEPRELAKLVASRHRTPTGPGSDDARPLVDRKSTRLNSSHIQKSRMPSSA